MQRHFKIPGNSISIRVADSQKKPSRMVSLLSHRPQFAQGGCVVATLIVTLAQLQSQTRQDWRDIRTRTGGDVESEKHGLIVTHGTISVGFWASPSRNSGAEPVYALPTQDSSPEIPVLVTTG